MLGESIMFSSVQKERPDFCSFNVHSMVGIIIDTVLQ